MTTGSDRNLGTTGERHQAAGECAVTLPPITAETARAAAAVLAPHLAAMRAVTAGTRFAVHGEDERRDGGRGAGLPQPPRMSPATRNFIAGMLERLPARDAGGAGTSVLVSS